MVERGSQLNVDPFPYPRTALSAMSERRSQDGGDEDLSTITDEAELGVRVDPATEKMHAKLDLLCAKIAVLEAAVKLDQLQRTQPQALAQAPQAAAVAPVPVKCGPPRFGRFGAAYRRIEDAATHMQKHATTLWWTLVLFWQCMLWLLLPQLGFLGRMRSFPVMSWDSPDADEAWCIASSLTAGFGAVGYVLEGPAALLRHASPAPKRGVGVSMLLACIDLVQLGIFIALAGAGLESLARTVVHNAVAAPNQRAALNALRVLSIAMPMWFMRLLDARFMLGGVIPVAFVAASGNFGDFAVTRLEECFVLAFSCMLARAIGLVQPGSRTGWAWRIVGIAVALSMSKLQNVVMERAWSAFMTSGHTNASGVQVYEVWPIFTAAQEAIRELVHPLLSAVGWTLPPVRFAFEPRP